MLESIYINNQHNIFNDDLYISFIRFENLIRCSLDALHCCDSDLTTSTAVLNMCKFWSSRAYDISLECHTRQANVLLGVLYEYNPNYSEWQSIFDSCEIDYSTYVVKNVLLAMQSKFIIEDMDKYISCFDNIFTEYVYFINELIHTLEFIDIFLSLCRERDKDGLLFVSKLEYLSLVDKKALNIFVRDIFINLIGTGDILYFSKLSTLCDTDSVIFNKLDKLYHNYLIYKDKNNR